MRDYYRIYQALIIYYHYFLLNLKSGSLSHKSEIILPSLSLISYPIISPSSPIL